MCGSPRDRGRAYGAAASRRVANTLRAYADLFVAYAGLSWDQVTQYAQRYEAVIGDFDHAMIEEIHGIADGAGVGFLDILALNVRTEVMYGLGEVRAAAECTAFAAVPPATVYGHTILGQNWDWHPAAFDSCVILAFDQEDRPSIVTVVEAGLLSKMGMNSEGVGVVTNAMATDVDCGHPGIPYHILLRAIQNCASVDQAVDLIRTVHRASSANYLVADRSGRAVDLEVAPGGPDHVFEIEPSDGVVAHANCFISPNATINDQTAARKPLSLTRQRTMDQSLSTHAGRISVDVMKDVLQDHEHHPNALCRHPLENLAPIDRSATVASVIMDLDTLDFWVADGQPCTHDYRLLTPSDVWPSAAGR